MLKRSRYLGDRPETGMDPLSDVLSLLKLRSYVSGGFEAGGDWAVAFAQPDGVKLYAVATGACWLAVDGVPEPVRIKAGDCFLLPRGRPFRLATDLGLTPIEASTIYRGVKDGGIRTFNGGGDFFCVGGHFALAGAQADVLLGMLPPIVHIHKEADKDVLRWCLERMRDELREPRPGGFLVAQQLATMLFVQAIRLHVADGITADGTRNGVGWLFALADKQMSAAINAMHAAPARRWTLQELAQHAGMSRTSFALKFKDTVGASPMDYLAQWRMLRAGDRLVNSSEAVSVIARSLGYESESAFSTAFKRVMGCSPRQYGRRREGEQEWTTAISVVPGSRSRRSASAP
jgi:AraC-like DNA-binding protein